MKDYSFSRSLFLTYLESTISTYLVKLAMSLSTWKSLSRVAFRTYSDNFSDSDH